MRYVIENETVYSLEQIGSAEIKASIGLEKRLWLISESDTEKVYQWQKFNTEKGEYVADEENTDTVSIDGKSYTPEKGKVVIKKEKTEAEKKIIEMELALAEMFETSQKLKEQGIQQSLAIAELYEGAIDKNA